MELVICEEPSLERLPCLQCNFVTSAKSKKDRTAGLRRHVKSHHAEKSFVAEAATEQTLLEDVQDDDEKNVSSEDETKKGASDNLTQILEPSSSDNLTQIL